MYMHWSKIAALIPARKGSKRVVNKNLKMFAGKPLVLWTMEAAVNSKLTNIFFSTDYIPDELGFTIPDGITWISRPSEICQDDSKANDYIRHFFDRYPNFEVVVLLQPTSPLRTRTDINRAVDKYLKSNNENLISVIRLDSKNKLYKPTGSSLYGTTYRPYDEPCFYRNSAIYIFTRKFFRAQGTIFAASSNVLYEMPMGRSFDVNTQLDFNYAERMLKYNNGVDLTDVDNCIDIDDCIDTDDAESSI